MKYLAAIIALALTSCAGLQLGISTDENGNIVIGGTIPAPPAEVEEAAEVVREK